MNLLRNAPTKVIIEQEFEGDQESAIEAATVLARTYAPEVLPAWVYELSTERPAPVLVSHSFAPRHQS